MAILNLVLLSLYFSIGNCHPLVSIRKNDQGITVLELIMKKEDYDYRNTSARIRMCSDPDMEIHCILEPQSVPRLRENHKSITHLTHNGISIASQEFFRSVPYRVINTKNRNSQTLGSMYYQCVAHVNKIHYMDEKTFSPFTVITNYDCSSDEAVEVQHHKAVIGNDIQLKCWDDPLQPNTTIEWILEGLWTGHQSLNEITEKLSLKNISHEHIGLYKCHVWFDNLHYRYSKHFDLRLLAPPLPPIRFRLTEASGTSYIFEWQPDPFDRLALADEAIQYWYKIRYNRMNRWIVDGPLNMVTNETSLAFYLFPDTWYRMEITAMNMYGESHPVRYDFSTNDPIEMYSDIIADTRITVAANQKNGNQKIWLPCRRYSNVSGIEWSQYVGESYWCCETKSHQRSIDLINDHVVGGLYKCKAPYTNGSQGIHEYTIRLSVIIQPKALRNLKCIGQDGGLALSWTWPSNDTEPTIQRLSVQYPGGLAAQDHAAYYLIQYTKLNSNRPSEWQEKMVGADEIKTILSGLESGLYAVRITAKNEAGTSEPKSANCRL